MSEPLHGPLARIALIVGVAVGLSSPSSAGCYRWDLSGELLIEPGQIRPDETEPARFIALRITQSGAALSGLATTTWFEDMNTAGLKGALEGDTLQFQTDWPTQGRGIVDFTGQVDAQGVVSGEARSWAHPQQPWRWRLRQPLTCAIHQSPASQAAQKQRPPDRTTQEILRKPPPVFRLPPPP